MKITTKARYGVRTMLELSKFTPGTPISARIIAGKQSIPLPYLEKILFTLKKAGLVNSTRGPGGGYLLTKFPKEISIGDILRALEGSITLAKCLKSPKECDKIEKCAARLLWKRLSEKIENLLDKISLQDLLMEERNLKERSNA